MPQYLIERNIPGADKLTSAELKAISQKSCTPATTVSTGPRLRPQRGREAARGERQLSSGGAFS
jgi:hypothetical protein